MGTEVDVFISNYTLVDPEIYQLWVEGHGAAEAVAILNQRGLGQVTGASLELIASDVLDHYRTYLLLEKLLSNPNKLQEQLALQIEPQTRQLLIEMYYDFDDSVVRELIGKKLTGKHRKDLDDISEKTGIPIKSCRRQFDNVKRVCKVVEDLPGSIIVNIQNLFYLTEKLAEKYACVVFLGYVRFETSKKKLNHVNFSMWKRCTEVMMKSWTNNSLLNLDELENKLFMELKDTFKALGDKEKDHKNLVCLSLKPTLLQKNYQDLDVNFKVYSRAILTLGSTLHRPRDMKTIFVELYNLAESFKQAGWTTQDVGIFLNGYTQSAFEIIDPLQCMIHTCSQEGVYASEWIKYAVPFKEGVPFKCKQYMSLNNNTCRNFSDSETQICDQYVYEYDQMTIVQEFNIYCENNLWKLTIVGTINISGELLSLPFTGIVSDRFGRKTMVTISVILTTVIGLLKSCSNSYALYIFLEFFSSILSSGMYSGAFILALEMVNTKQRNMMNLIICIAYASGQIILGVIACITQSWRIMLRILYLPGVLITVGLWYVPESMVWLISKHRITEAWHVMEMMSKRTGLNINREEIDFTNLHEIADIDHPSHKKTKVIVLRTVICSVIWICCNLSYNGLAIESVALSEDTYINFILQAVIEIPAYIVTYFSITISRKKSLSSSLILAGAFCILVNLVEQDKWLKLGFFLCGKFFITMAFTTLYIYTAEMAPTNIRHCVFSICAMFGRMGSMVSPQVPLLASISNTIPMGIFATVSFSAGFVALSLPETLKRTTL